MGNFYRRKPLIKNLAPGPISREPYYAVVGPSSPGPTPPTPTSDYLYFEAVEANSTVSLMSTLTTAPILEYSTDGTTWQEWPHTTAEGTHTFDTITLGAVGDRVYLRGNNPDGFSLIGDGLFSLFAMDGKIAAGGNAQSLVDGDAPTLVAKTMPLFNPGETSDVLVSAPSLPATTLADGCYSAMFYGCTFAMSDDGTTFNFDFGAPPPVTAGEMTFSTCRDLADWMGNINGFN